MSLYWLLYKLSVSWYFVHFHTIQYSGSLSQGRYFWATCEDSPLGETWLSEIIGDSDDACTRIFRILEETISFLICKELLFQQNQVTKEVQNMHMRTLGFCLVGTVAPTARSKRFVEEIAVPLCAIVGSVRSLCAVVGSVCSQGPRCKI